MKNHCNLVAEDARKQEPHKNLVLSDDLIVQFANLSYC